MTSTTGSKRKPTRWSKEQGIGVAVIGGIVALIAAYWQFVYKPNQSPSPEPIKYAGRVLDGSNQQVIKGAKVSVDTQGVPQVYYTDSDGVFYLKLSGSTDATRIRIEADGYEMFDRNVSLSRTGVEDIRLTRNVPTTPNTTLITTPSPSPTIKKPRQRPQRGQRDDSEDILLGNKNGPPVP